MDYGKPRHPVQGAAMREVEPIRDPAMLTAIKARLHAQNLRDAAWFTVGINTGLPERDTMAYIVGVCMDADGSS